MVGTAGFESIFGWWGELVALAHERYEEIVKRYDYSVVLSGCRVQRSAGTYLRDERREGWWANQRHSVVDEVEADYFIVDIETFGLP